MAILINYNGGDIVYMGTRSKFIEQAAVRSLTI